MINKGLSSFTLFLIPKEIPSEWKVTALSTTNIHDEERSDESDDSDEDSTMNESMFDVLAPSDLSTGQHKRGTFSIVPN